MNSLNRCQWLVFVVVVVIGVFVSLGLQHLFMQVFLKPEKVARDAAKRVGKAPGSLDYKKLGHLGTGLQGWVGTIEIILYSTSIVFRHPEFIAVWLGTKYVAAYRTWGKEPVGRTFYNRSLFGSGLNILLGAGTGGVALWAIDGAQQVGHISILGIARIPANGGAMLQTILGAVIAILFAILVEYLRRPNLKLSIEPTAWEGQFGSIKDMRVVRIEVLNEPLTIFARWMLRAPALQCRAAITFHCLDNRNVFGSRAMAGRWSNSEQPVAIPILDPHGVEQFRMIDYGRLSAESRIDVYPGESEHLDIAARFGDDEECYGWNNESYFHPDGRNVNWKLPRGRYLVRVTISSSGQKRHGGFCLINEAARSDFRLEPES